MKQYNVFKNHKLTIFDYLTSSCIMIMIFFEKLCLGTSLLSFMSASETKAQSKADIVSSYVWRGSKAAGASIQPFISASIFDFTLGAW